MTRNLTKAIGAGVLTLSMAILPLTLPVKAQVTEPGVQTTPRTTVIEEDDGFDWGWLGLIGLFGLAGLAGKNRTDEPTRYRDPSAPGATTYRD
ncbi:MULTISPECIES: WGxxGxxG family protein [unclassified Anabaena]|uniref:WGxxGxxG family protein n=1 Tax=unclassified Anabaena TaxID=2619674 RepID=UPI0039C619AF